MRLCMLAFPLGALLGACGFSSTQLEATPDATIVGEEEPPPPIDAAPISDAAIDATETPHQLCVGAFIAVCFDRELAPITLTTQAIDTSTSPLCGTAQLTPAIDACVIAGTSVVIPGGETVRVTGSRPLILLATGSLTLSGVVDAASHRGGTTGPGAELGPCSTTIKNPTVGASGDGGGGWGGSFGAAGNNGGNGGLGGGGGTAAPAIATTTLRGGCPGAKGAGTIGGAGGRGGGAVLLIAKQTLTIDGAVNASGAAGEGGKTGGGGGGGGSGGMIALDAATVNVPGQSFANGGGGGEGANLAADGIAGSEPTAPNTIASGGKLGTMFGGDGGGGGFGSTPGGSPGNGGSVATDHGNIVALGGGGGGGGGVGVTKLFATEQHNTDDTTKVAPRPSN